MPIYEIRCKTCGEVNEVMCPYDEMKSIVATGVCPTCGKTGFEQVVGTPALIIPDDSRRDKAKQNLNKIARDDARRKGENV